MQQLKRPRQNLFAGVVAGVLAFSVGYFLTRHMVQMGTVPSTEVEAGESIVAGWFFYNAHHVPLAESLSAFGETMTASGYDLLDMDSTSEYLDFLYVIPPLILFIFGVLAAASEGKTRSISLAFVNGASIVVGYLIAVIIGLVIFAESITTMGVTGTLRPDIIQSLIIAGVVYPVIFGGIGGVAYFLSQGSIKIQSYGP